MSQGTPQSARKLSAMQRHPEQSVSHRPQKELTADVLSLDS